MDAARFTDAPRYHFDLSAAKPLINDRLKISVMAGIYIWHLNTEGQNDAVLYGGSIEYNYNNSSSFEKKIQGISILLTLQQGLRDYDFTSVETGIRYNFK